MTNDAVCRTFVPTTLAGYFSQQLRWRRSNIVDYVGGMSHVWRLNPIIAIHFFSLFGLLVAYPALIARAVMRGTFLPLLVSHIIGAFGFGLIYRWYVRKEKPEHRVSSLAFVPIALVLPIIYAWLTPVALFTLDSSSWETRGHEGTDETDETEESGEIEVPALAKPQPASSIGMAARGATASAGRTAKSALASQIIE
jgi:hypothetical protein